MGLRRCRNMTSLRKIRRYMVFALFLFGTLKLCGFYYIPRLETKAESRATGRHLLSTVEWEQCDFEIGHKRNYSYPSTWHAPSRAYGWVVLYCLLILIVFVALAIICDDFFVPSLEAISERLDLSEDVAGATFMAAGSSAPELFTSIAGVTVESDVGVGTIVGSAVFNLLGICALSAAFAGQVLHLDWRPLTRDATYYALSICMFILFAWDGKFHIWESCVLLLFYFMYILLMKFNPQLMEFMAKWGKKVVPITVHSEDGASTTMKDSDIQTNQQRSKLQIDSRITLREEEGAVEGKELKKKFSHINKGYLPKELTHYGAEHAARSKTAMTMNKSNTSIPPIKFLPQGSNIIVATEVDELSVVGGDEVDDTTTSLLVCPCLPRVNIDIPVKPTSSFTSILRCVLSWIFFVISFPFVVAFTWTIPNCSTPETKKYYLFSFVMSIVWIAALSFGMVTLVGRAGCILGVDKFTMGLVVVAIGTSIPDALSSILVARDGFGDMAVSNAIGSNVFDIDLGLGLPFLISSLIRNFEPVKILSAAGQAKYDSGEIIVIPHVKFGFILLMILALSLIVFTATKFRLNKYLGLTFVLLYFCFVGYAYIQDLYCNNNC